ncbi:MAG TPA: glycosyltransferase family 9 protein [Anaerolineae bacterium]|nr:glycosyltransferase family 9 protein [Anaerolineae bacterium]
MPALRALRAALPQAQILIIGLPAAAPLARRFGHYLDGLLQFPGFPGIPEAPPELGSFGGRLLALQRQHLDVLLQMHGHGGIMNVFAGLVGASLTAGYYLPGNYCPDPDTFLPYDETEPEVRRWLRLLEALGIPAQGEALEFPVDGRDEEALAALLPAQSLQPGTFACIHPGARGPARRWDPAHFAAVADALVPLGLDVVLTGTRDEKPVARAVTGAMRACTPLNLTGRTTLGSLAALVGRARIVVCNDTGVSHLAAAMGTPSVVVFGDPRVASDPRRWAPLDRDLHRALAPSPDGPRMSVTPQAVLREVWQLLAEDGPRYG